jgi:hypothetical protein
MARLSLQGCVRKVLDKLGYCNFLPKPQRRKNAASCFAGNVLAHALSILLFCAVSWKERTQHTPTTRLWGSVSENSTSGALSMPRSPNGRQRLTYLECLASFTSTWSLKSKEALN